MIDGNMIFSAFIELLLKDYTFLPKYFPVLSNAMSCTESVWPFNVLS